MVTWRRGGLRQVSATSSAQRTRRRRLFEVTGGPRNSPGKASLRAAGWTTAPAVIAHYHYTRCVLRILSGARRCSLRHGGGAGHAKDAGASARRAPFWLRNDLKIGAQKEADRLHAALPRSSPTSVASKRPDFRGKQKKWPRPNSRGHCAKMARHHRGDGERPSGCPVSKSADRYPLKDFRRKSRVGPYIRRYRYLPLRPHLAPSNVAGSVAARLTTQSYNLLPVILTQSWCDSS